MSLRIDFVEGSARWKRALPAHKLARAAIAAAIAESGVKLKRGVEVSLHLIDDEAITAVNAEWRQKESPTNVLSFPAVDADEISEARHLGDLLIAFETLQREAEDEGKTLADHYQHLVVHGFLHLIGYDHIEVDAAEAMEALEVRTLARLGVADPYENRELTDLTP